MSEKNDPEFDDADDRALRDRLAASAPDPSAGHDDAVLAAARAFTEQPAAEAAQDASSQEPAISRVPRWPMAAAAVLALGVAVTLILPALQTAEPVVRGGAADLVPARGAELSEPPSRFELPASYHGLSCNLSLIDAAGEVRWQSASFDASVSLPATVASTLTDGHYQWRGLCKGRGEVSFGPYPFSISR